MVSGSAPATAPAGNPMPPAINAGSPQSVLKGAASATFAQDAPVSFVLGLVCLLAYIVPHPLLRFTPDGGPLGLAWLAPTVEHGSVTHLLFNLQWLYKLGPLLEQRLRPWGAMPLALLTMAAGSNYAQYWMTGPNFLGLSGVVYGIAAFLVVASPRTMRPLGRTFCQQFLMCIAMSHMELKNVANTAHGAGAVVGALLGGTFALLGAHGKRPRRARRALGQLMGNLKSAAALVCVLAGFA